MKDSNTPATKADITRLENRLGERFDERFDRVDEQFDKVDERFDKIDERLDNLSERMDESFDEVHEKLDALSHGRRKLHVRVENHEKRLTKLEATVGIAS